MAFDYASTARTLLELVGGESNVASVTHCMTRLRFVLRNQNKANKEKVEETPGVLRVIQQGGQFQVVIGNEVAHVYNEISKLGNFAETAEGVVDSGNKENLFSRLCGFIAGCMTPLLPAMLGCGMINVILTILTTFELIGTDGSTYIILSSMGNTFMYFLPIMLAYTTAKKVGMNPFVAMAIGGLLVYPDIVSLLAAGNTSLFGITVTSATYSSSVLPILMMVPIMGYIERFADKICPNMVKIFLKPMIVLLVSLPLALIVIGPLGTIIGGYVADGINFLYSKAGWLTIMVLSAVMPFIVMTGMHYSLVPIAYLGFATFGYDALLIVTMFCSNIAQGGASLGVAVKTKNKDIKSTAAACGVSAAVAGITEPAMYGITLKYKKPMIAAMIAAGAAGLYAGITGLVSYVMGGSPSFLTLITMIGSEGYGNLINGIITAVITFAASFIISFVIYKDDAAASAEPVSTITAEASSAKAPLVERIEVTSPLTGKVIPLTEVKDETFSSKALGEGAAIIPTEGKVYAPADGTITVLMDTRHAIGMATDKGTELLIHIGMDTVELNGKYFTAKCKQGDKVKSGDLLLEFDIAGIKEAGYEIATPVVVANSTDYVSIKPTTEKEVKKGAPLLTIV